VEPRKLESGCLLESQRDVGGVDRLPRGAFHHVVDRREDDDALVRWVEFEADLGQIGAGDRFGFGVAVDARAAGGHANERLVLVAAPIGLPEVALRDGSRGEDVVRCARAADHVHGVAGEGDRGVEELLDLGLVAVAGRRVRTDDARALGVARGLAAAGAALRRPYFHVDDDLLAALENSVFEQRVEAQNGRGGVTATARDEVRSLEVLAIDLGKCVLGPFEVFRGLVPVVPLFVLGFALEAEVRREVDDGIGNIEKVVDPAHGDAVWRRREQDVDALEIVGLGKAQVRAAQRRVDGAHALAGFRTARDLRNIEIRMASEQSQELAAREAAPADDACGDGLGVCVRAGLGAVRHQALTSSSSSAAASAFDSSQSTTVPAISVSTAPSRALNSTVWLTSWTV